MNKEEPCGCIGPPQTWNINAHFNCAQSVPKISLPLFCTGVMV